MKLRTSKKEFHQPVAAVGAAAEMQVVVDSKVECPPEMWKQWADEMLSTVEKGFGFNSERPASLLVMAPERRDELGLDRIYERLLNAAKTEFARGSSMASGDYRQTVQFCLLFPDRKSELPLNDDFFQKSKMSEGFIRNSGLSCLGDLYRLYIMFPERREDMIFDSTFDQVKNIPDSYSDEVFLYKTMQLCVLFPERRKDLNIAEALARGQRCLQYLDEFRKPEVMSYMYICVADEVRIGDNGMELINRDELGQRPELPIRSTTA